MVTERPDAEAGEHPDAVATEHPDAVATGRPAIVAAGRGDATPHHPVTVVFVMGVSGSGKSTIGSRLAARLGWPYADADDFHPPANIAKMRAGTPLTDEDRRPWLAAMADWLSRQLAAGRCAATSGSALKRRHRDFLRAGRPSVRFVYLRGDRRLIAERLAARTGHFFPASLLDTQFRELEPPAPDEGVLAVSVDKDPEEITTEIIQRLRLTPSDHD